MKAVVTLGKYFGPKHPRKGQETGFIAKKVKSLRGCEVKNWVGFQNGNGTDVGQDIERLIKRAEREQKYLLTVKHE